MPCRFWTGVPGSCRNGERCPFGHSKTAAPQSGVVRSSKRKGRGGKAANKKMRNNNYAVHEVFEPGAFLSEIERRTAEIVDVRLGDEEANEECRLRSWLLQNKKNLKYVASEVESTTRASTVEQEEDVSEMITMEQTDVKLKQIAEELSHSTTVAMVENSTDGGCSIGTQGEVLDQVPPMKRGRFEGFGEKTTVVSHPVTSNAFLPVTNQDASDTVTCPSRYKELCDSLADSLNRLEKEDNKQLSVHMITLYKLMADVELSLS